MIKKKHVKRDSDMGENKMKNNSPYFLKYTNGGF